MLKRPCRICITCILRTALTVGTVTSETPTVQLQIQLPAGERYVRKGQEGLNLTASMMEEGSTKRTVEELQATLDKLWQQRQRGAPEVTPRTFRSLR